MVIERHNVGNETCIKLLPSTAQQEKTKSTGRFVNIRRGEHEMNKKENNVSLVFAALTWFLS